MAATGRRRGLREASAAAAAGQISIPAAAAAEQTPELGLAVVQALLSAAVLLLVGAAVLPLEAMSISQPVRFSL